MSARIAVIHHNRELNTGRLDPFLEANTRLDVWAPDGEFPRDLDAIVIMGGFMGAHETDRYPWLGEEQRWLAGRVEAETPVLGICLGAQLLAVALGGGAFTAPHPEVGVVEVDLTEDGARHPVVSHIGDRAFLAHEDTFALPPEATLLAATAAYPAAFECGSALALQPHLETHLYDALSWADHPGFDLLERAGMSREIYADRLRDHSEEAEARAKDVFGAWFSRSGLAVRGDH